MWPLLSTPKQYNLHIKGNKRGWERRKSIQRRWRWPVGKKKIQHTYLRISAKYDPCTLMMTSRNRDAVAFLFKKPQCWSFPPRSQLRRCSSPSVFLTNKISPLSKMPKGPLLSYPLTFYTHTPLSIWASWVPSPSAPKFPSSAWEPHPSLLLLNLQGQLTPSVFSLLHHGFVVGCKEPKPRPKMDPQHCPKPIWSLRAWAM